MRQIGEEATKEEDSDTAYRMVRDAQEERSRATQEYF